MYLYSSTEDFYLKVSARPAKMSVCLLTEKELYEAGDSSQVP